MIIAKDGEVAIRELKESDIPELAEYANNKKVSMNLRDGFPSPYTTNDAEKFLELVSRQNPKTYLAIEYQGCYVGNISLLVGSDVYRKGAEIGYFLGEPFWNKGIATKAVKLITKWGFENLDIVWIYTGVFEFNKASLRVLEKCGFEKEAISRKAIFKNGQFYDEIRYALIK